MFENIFKNKNKDELVQSSYSKEDVIFLLKDLTNIMPDTTLEDKEKMIAQGINYSEMISKESYMNDDVNNLFCEITKEKKQQIADLIEKLAFRVIEHQKDSPFQKEKDVLNKTVLVSLARAGTPIGVLLKKYYEYIYDVNVPHYSISIIRDKGIDENAVKYILTAYPRKKIIFIDGWTGKGSIGKELKKSIRYFNAENNLNISSDLAVLADPAHTAQVYATREDICIPNACLNSTVSGLVSRTIHNKHYIGINDFHGAKYYGDLANMDFSNWFIEQITNCFVNFENKDVYKVFKIEQQTELQQDREKEANDGNYIKNVIETLNNKILKKEQFSKYFFNEKNEFAETDYTKLKLSIGETSRTVLRRSPKLIIVNNLEDENLKFVLYMANQRKVDVIEYPSLEKETGYKCISFLI